MTYKLLDRAGSVVYLSDCLYCYFKNADSITGRGFYLKRLDVIEAIEERTAYFYNKKDVELIIFSCLTLRDIYLRYAYEVSNAGSITKTERAAHLRQLKQRARKTLVLYGISYYPIRYNEQYYAFAFPTLTLIIRWCLKVLRPLYNFVKVIFHL